MDTVDFSVLLGYLPNVPAGNPSRLDGTNQSVVESDNFVRS
jgi:hypothetical protein